MMGWWLLLGGAVVNDKGGWGAHGAQCAVSDVGHRGGTMIRVCAKEKPPGVISAHVCVGAWHSQAALHFLHGGWTLLGCWVGLLTGLCVCVLCLCGRVNRNVCCCVSKGSRVLLVA